MSFYVRFGGFVVAACLLMAVPVWLIIADPILGMTFSTAPLALHVSALPSTIISLVALVVMLAITIEGAVRGVRYLAHQRGHR